MPCFANCRPGRQTKFFLSLSLSQTHTRIKTDCITNNCKGEPVKMIHKEATPFVRTADKNLTSISVIYGSKNEAFFEAFLGNELG